MWHGNLLNASIRWTGTGIPVSGTENTGQVTNEGIHVEDLLNSELVIYEYLLLRRVEFGGRKIIQKQ